MSVEEIEEDSTIRAKQVHTPRRHLYDDKIASFWEAFVRGRRDQPMRPDFEVNMAGPA